MTPHRNGPRAYWHSGGAIESRRGGISLRRALALFRFYAREAVRSAAQEDTTAHVFCARTSLELADALCEFERWTLAAGPLSAGCEARVWRENSRRWLTNAASVKKLLNYLDSLDPS